MDDRTGHGMIDYSKLRSSLKRLDAQNANYRLGNPALSDLDREGVAESVTRRFKMCYDCLWKVLRRYLTHELGIAETPNSPKPVFKLAHENDLFAAPIEQWFRYADAGDYIQKCPYRIGRARQPAICCLRVGQFGFPS